MKLVNILLSAALILCWNAIALPQTALQGGDNIGNAFVIPPNIGSFADTGSTVGYTDDYDGNCGIDGGAPDVVYRFATANDEGAAVSFRNDTDFSARLYVFRDTPDSIVGCIDNPYSEIICLSIVDNHTYYFVIDGYDGASGHYSFAFDQLSLPPSIDGIITESGGGPIGGATIRALQGGNEVWRDTTWDDGYYSTYLWSGIYIFEASRQGYVTQTSEPVYSAPCEYHRVDFALERYVPPPIGTIAGVVTQADSITPIEGAIVEATWQDGSLVLSDTTDSQGAYAINDLQLGLYDVEASKALYETQIQHDIEVFSDQSTMVDFALAHSLCHYTPGDVNGNGIFNGLDVTYMVGYFKGGPPPPIDCHPYCPNEPNPFYAAGDVNGDCVFNGLDISFFVVFLKGGPWIRFCPDCPPGR